MGAVDVMFVLSGLLAALHLVPLLEAAAATASKPTLPSSTCALVLAYWGRRARRILPAYAATNLLVATALGPPGLRPHEAAVSRWMVFYHCPANLWANGTFLQNALLGSQACGEKRREGGREGRGGC